MEDQGKQYDIHLYWYMCQLVVPIVVVVVLTSNRYFHPDETASTSEFRTYGLFLPNETQVPCSRQA